MKAILVAGTHSGVGKTTVTLGLMATFLRRGLVVQPFKVGPDYIDTGHHQVVCGRPSYNLDTWMMGKEAVSSTFFRVMKEADIGVVEGVMGLFDGKEGKDEEGSTAHIARVLGLPVILVADVRGTSRSAGAIIYGFERFDPKLNIAGVIFNRVGSDRHFRMLKETVETKCKARVLGYIPRDDGITLPERHLGLVTVSGGERHGRAFHGQGSGVRERLVDLVERFVDIDEVLKLSSKFKIQNSRPSSLASSPWPLTPVRIAIAMDKAFSFYYQENLDMMEKLGAELIFFSPLKDKKLPDDIKGIYIGGGYPELYAKTLEANGKMRAEIKEWAEKGLPTYAECGGLMYLGKGLRDIKGRTHQMVGLFPWTSRMLNGIKFLGYREIVVWDGCPFIK
ncbi:MAG: cobyrinate a,c-diamide synthase, partial [Deltaproteobacteria bacterium]|nr:cobyrinate a,c-diamide synthase [Deltaproteobacteria bacterium]